MNTNESEVRVGDKYGRYTVLRSVKTKERNRKWSCRCQCGIVKTVYEYPLVHGLTVSCGCYRRERVTKAETTHGMTGTPEYKTWNQIKFRTTNPKCVGYKYYGAKGVKVCQRWLESFDNFMADMGKRPSRLHSIDRINPFGDYEPSNCRWATPKQQANNKRNTYAR